MITTPGCVLTLADTASATKEAITYEAATIRYVLPKSRIELARDAHLTYNDLDLRARRVQFDSEKQTLVAEGSPELVDRGDKVDGQLMTYDLESRVGNIYKAETTYEKGLYHGERIRKVSDNEFAVEVIPVSGNAGAIKTSIYGPFNYPFYQYRIDKAMDAVQGSAERSRARKEMERRLEEEKISKRIDVPVTFTVADDASSVTIEVQANKQIVRVGEWSDWSVIDFPINWLVDRAKPLRGIARWKVLSTRPDLRVYLSPLNFHPASQPVPFSYPVAFAEQLKDRLGYFKTLGWIDDTWTLPAGLVTDEFFLEDMNHNIDDFEKMMETELGESRDKLYVQVFDFTDRIGHMFWRYLDASHPYHDPGHDPVHVARMQEEMLKAYQRMDEIVGKARKLAGPDVLFMVLSDHGFGSFRRGMNYNSWLVAHGYTTWPLH